MDYPRRKSQASSNPTIIRAVAVGMVVGLFISGAMFYHKMKLQTLEAELLSDLSLHVSSIASTMMAHLDHHFPPFWLKSSRRKPGPI